VTVPLRDAATVMLVRDAVDGAGAPAIEVCMLRRTLAAEFVAGAYVFPGGSVDSDDRGPAAEALCRGRTDAEASATLGIESGGLAFWVAALRECFEEAGVLLAHAEGGPTDPQSLLDLRDPEVATRFAAHRVAVNAGQARLLDICRDEGLVLAADTVHYVSHWITPELAPKRYDTRFFVTVAPPGQVASHDDGETIATIWVRPADALTRSLAGEIELLPPTIANLASIEPFHTTDEVVAWASAITHVPTVLPIVLMEDGQVLILRPGDEGYEQAVKDRLAAGGEVEADLAAVARDLWGPKTPTT
jgi:8-oxo-dGTP pyrophosphatase MutT (NUDIX family)